MVTTKEALTLLEERGIKVSYSNLALWARTGKFEGAQLDTANPRGAVWLIPEDSVKRFEPPKTGRPPKAKPTNGAAKKGSKR